MSPIGAGAESIGSAPEGLRVQMRSDAVNIDIPLVQGLVGEQFPQWADLPIREVIPNGWDNRTFRLGEYMSVRLPSARRYAPQVEKEQLWLPKLAPLLPLPVPAPLAHGKPAAGYPFPWSVYGWIDGDTATAESVVDLSRFADSLGEFLVALQAIETTGAPGTGAHNFYRGGDLSTYDEETRRAIAVLGDDLDTSAVTEVWEAALAVTYHGPPVWIHGDVSAGNLLVRNGLLSAVIDFGGTAVGDPACDLAIAWTMFEGESRDTFRAALPLDDATWARGRGWALWKALIVMGGLSVTNAVESENSRRTISRILADHSQSA